MFRGSIHLAGPMVDTRFHSFAGPIPLGHLLLAVEFPHSLEDAGPLIEGVEELHLAGPGHLALASQGSYRDALQLTRAGAVVVAEAMVADVPPGTLAVVAQDPHALFVEVLDRLYPSSTSSKVTGILAPRATAPLMEAGVEIGQGAVLGPGVEIGRGSVIGPNTVVGAGVTIGRNAVIGSNCSIECSYLGNDVVVHSGARIGTEGFGWLDLGRTNRKIPQLGRVIMQDNVEVGANSTIDRGALGDTVVGQGTKIDNLVQIGHNCRIGRNCLIAGTAALAGSTIVEDGVMFGGGAASSGHLTIGAGSVLAARTLVTKDLPAGSHVAGYPAQEMQAWRRGIATLRRLSRRTESGR